MHTGSADGGDGTVPLPDSWDDATVVVRELSDDVLTLHRVDDGGAVAPLAVELHQQPILVDVHFGRSAIVTGPLDAIEYGFRADSYRCEFYFLDLQDSPSWQQITEESGGEVPGIYRYLDDWVADGQLSEEKAEWARNQFE